MRRKMIINLMLVIALSFGTVPPVNATTVSDNGIDISVKIADNKEEISVDDSYSELQESLLQIVENHEIEVLLYGVPSYDLKLDPMDDTSVVCTVPIGSQLQIKDVIIFENQDVYYLVEYVFKDQVYQGYIADSNIVTNDNDFNHWREKELSKAIGEKINVEGSSAADIQTNFPQGYWEPLTQLAATHPNWIFVPFNTGLQWSEVVNAEREGNRSLVYKTVVDSWKSKDAGDYNAVTGVYIPKSGANWFRASETAVTHCLNPINYMDESHIFAFEQLTYNSGVHNEAGVNAIIQKSWMANRALEDGSGGLYSAVFMEVGAQTGVSPYHLASRVLQEQGLAGSAALISGYGGVYNYFNVQANGNTADEILANGTAYAQGQGWITRYLSIYGGAERLGTNYITKGQDTLYLQKFDVEASHYGLYSHQYMQNVQAPTTESISVYNAYSSANAINNNFVFRIPVYLNMPGNQTFQISEDFIIRLYNVILDRNPDASGYANWKKSMASGTSAAEVALGFFWSKEFTNKNMSDSQFLDYAYRAILGREADEKGKEGWLRELAQGSTRNSVLRGFLYSKEFSNLCNQYGVIRGDIDHLLRAADIYSDKTKFVVRLYRNILNREPDRNGLNNWVDQLCNGMSASHLVSGFVHSKEFMNANLSNEDYVEILYQTMLGRGSDANGKANWVRNLRSGAGRDEVLCGFLYSKEFGKLCAQYGIAVGTL